MKKESGASTGRRVNVCQGLPEQKNSEKNFYFYQAPEKCFLVHSESIKAASSQKVITSVADPDRIFFIPDPGSRLKQIPDSGYGSTSKNLSIFYLKILFLNSRKYDPDPDFLPIPDPGVKKAPVLGSATLVLTRNILPKNNTDLLVLQLSVFFFPLRDLPERFGLGGGDGDDIS
jgi:hypothetical protein